MLFIEPYYLKYSTTFLSESITAIFVLLLALSFVVFGRSKKLNVIIPIISVITILSHPVSIFFVMTLLIIYGVINLKYQPIKMVVHGLLVISLLAIWPLRNQQISGERFYLTASQGASFSKAWNENVVTRFTNVDGDLADETLNLKYVININDDDKHSFSWFK